MIGLTLSLYSSMKARTIELVDEPRVEKAIVFLSLRSFRVLIGEDAFAYQ